MIALDTEGDLEIVDFDGNTMIEKDFSLKQNRVRATPVFLVYGLDGKPLKNGRLTGATRDADEFLLFGQYLVEGHHNQVSFTAVSRYIWTVTPLRTEIPRVWIHAGIVPSTR